MAQQKKLFCGSSIARTRLSLALGVIVAALAVLAAGCSQSEDVVAIGSGSATSTSQTSLSSVTSRSPAAENTATSTSLPLLGTTATQAPEEPSSSSSKITTTTTTSLVPVEAEATLPEETVPESTPPEETVPDTTLPEETVPETTLPEETAVEVALPEETEAASALPKKALEIMFGSVYLSSSGSPLSVSLNPVHSRNFVSLPSWIGKQPSTLSSLINTPGDYLLELLDASDSVLRSISFEAAEIETECDFGPCPESDEPSRASFSIYINDSPDYLKLRFSKSGNVFDTITRSASTPSIYDLVLSVPEPEAQAAGEDILLTWSATDDDNDDLLFIVFYSADSGIRIPDSGIRIPFVSSWGTDATSMNISLDSLGGSDAARIAVSVSDGLRTAFIESETFSVPNKPPEASIVGSTDSTISGSQSSVLSASGYDREDGNLPSVAFSWHSSIDGDLGTGRFIVVSGADLTAGEHEITMTARDSAGNQVTDRIRITVNK